jgi:hypothetical protein
LRLVVGAEVAAGAVLGAQDDEAVALVVGAVVLGVVEQAEDGAGGGGAQVALGLHLLALGVQGSHLAQGGAALRCEQFQQRGQSISVNPSRLNFDDLVLYQLAVFILFSILIRTLGLRLAIETFFLNQA